MTGAVQRKGPNAHVRLLENPQYVRSIQWTMPFDVRASHVALALHPDQVEASVSAEASQGE